MDGLLRHLRSTPMPPAALESGRQRNVSRRKWRRRRRIKAAALRRDCRWSAPTGLGLIEMRQLARRSALIERVFCGVPIDRCTEIRQSNRTCVVRSGPPPFSRPLCLFPLRLWWHSMDGGPTSCHFPESWLVVTGDLPKPREACSRVSFFFNKEEIHFKEWCSFE